MTKNLIIFYLLGVALTSAITNNCIWRDPKTGDVYDFSSLRRDNNWMVTDVDHPDKPEFRFRYIFNFCEPIHDDQVDPADQVAALKVTEVLSAEVTLRDVFGRLDRTTISSDINVPLPGFKITYDSETFCFSGARAKTILNIACSKTQDSSFIMMNPGADSLVNCNPEFIIHSPAGCAIEGANSKSGSSGTLFYLFLFVCLYFLLGTFYNVKYKSQKGLEAIPHIDNIRKIPSYASNVTSFVKEKVMNKSGGLTTSGPSGHKYTLV